MSKSLLAAVLLLTACGEDPRFYPTEHPSPGEQCWRAGDSTCQGTVLNCTPVDRLRDGGFQADPKSLDLVWVDSHVTCG